MLLELPELVPELLELEPHAASTNASAATVAIAATVLIDLIESPPVLLIERPHRAPLGFRASLSPSPSRLKASTVSSRAAPGKTMYHHAVLKIGVAEAIICPQLAVGGRMPTPRNESAASIRMLVG